MPPRHPNESVLTRAFLLWRASHAPEYLGLILLLSLWMLVCCSHVAKKRSLAHFTADLIITSSSGQLRFLVSPFRQLFFIDDSRIAYPIAETERISTVINITLSLIVPLAILVVYNLVVRARAPQHEATYLAFAVSIVLTGFITILLKNSVGRPRPDFLSRCQPAPDAPHGVPVTADVCTTLLTYRLEEGWRSFPSGHASFAFSGLGFLAIFFCGQLGVMRVSAGGRDLTRALVCLLPVLVAGCIALSRCQDYRHDVYDVSVGSLIGLTIAHLSYRRHWPSLRSPSCHEPYPHPSAVTQGGWHTVVDEESLDTL